MGIRRKRRKQNLDPDFENMVRREEAMRTLQKWGESEFGSSELRPNVRIMSDAEWAEYVSRRLADDAQV